jgi:hypothetical protein
MIRHKIVVLNCSSIALDSYKFTYHTRVLWYQKTRMHLAETIDRLWESRPGGPLKQYMGFLWEGVFEKE